MFDEVRWLNWALAKVRQAKKAGQLLSLNDLMVKRESIKNRKDTPPKEPKSRRRPKPVATDSPAEDLATSNYADMEEG